MRNPLVGIGVGAAGIALIATLYLAGIFGTIGQAHVNAYIAKKTVNSRIAEQTHQPGYKIEAYNHFYDLCASVQTMESSLDAQYTELKTATGDDRSRIEANIAGLQSARADAINQYNADARKSYTLGQFRDSGLPFQLTLTQYNTKEEKTTCIV